MARKPSPKSESQEARLAALDVAIRRGLADAEKGRVKPLATVFDRLEAKYRNALPQPAKRSE
jgi:antitoxin ParD1/3/4